MCIFIYNYMTSVVFVFSYSLESIQGGGHDKQLKYTKIYQVWLLYEYVRKKCKKRCIVQYNL